MLTRLATLDRYFPPPPANPPSPTSWRLASLPYAFHAAVACAEGRTNRMRGEGIYLQGGPIG
eukprot:8816411-Pyramimonas_sp.AAC.1